MKIALGFGSGYRHTRNPPKRRTRPEPNKLPYKITPWRNKKIRPKRGKKPDGPPYKMPYKITLWKTMKITRERSRTSGQTPYKLMIASNGWSMRFHAK